MPLEIRLTSAPPTAEQIQSAKSHERQAGSIPLLIVLGLFATSLLLGEFILGGILLGAYLLSWIALPKMGALGYEPAEPLECAEIAVWREKYPVVDAYCNAVLAQGRAVILLEYWVLEDYAQEKEDQEKLSLLYGDRLPAELKRPGKSV